MAETHESSASVVGGLDGENSDIDLLVAFDMVLSLVTLERNERELTAVLDRPVDVTPQSQLPPHMRDRAEREAVHL